MSIGDCCVPLPQLAFSSDSDAQFAGARQLARVSPLNSLRSTSSTTSSPPHAIIDQRQRQKIATTSAFQPKRATKISFCRPQFHSLPSGRFFALFCSCQLKCTYALSIDSKFVAYLIRFIEPSPQGIRY